MAWYARRASRACFPLKIRHVFWKVPLRSGHRRGSLSEGCVAIQFVELWIGGAPRAPRYAGARAVRPGPQSTATRFTKG